MPDEDIPPYARKLTTRSEDLDKRIAAGVTFPIRVLHGIEFRGLLGDIIKEVDVQPTEEENTFQVKVVLVARCVESGHPNREVILDTLVRVAPDLVPLPGLTKEQHIVVHMVQNLIRHEIAEDLRLEGKHILPHTHDL